MKRILLADDSAATRSMLATVLGDLDVEIIEASSGFEALRLLPREPVDLIITDINMPDINGLELISFVRNNAQFASVPLFIISTEGGERDLRKGLSIGANEYLVKPFPPQRLQELVQQYLFPPGGAA